MFNRYNFNPSPKPKTLQDYLAEKAMMQQGPATTPQPSPFTAIDTKTPFDTGNVDFGNPLKKPSIDMNGASFGDLDLSGATPPASLPEERQPSILERFRQAKNPYIDQLAELLQNQPKREDFKTDWKDWLFGGLEGAGLAMAGNLPAGLDAIDNIRNNDFNQANADYQGKIKNAGMLADLGEHKYNDEIDKLKFEDTSIRDDENFKIRVKELEDRGWTAGIDEITGQQIWSNRDGRTITGKQIRESLADETKRLAGVAKVEADARQKIVETQTSSREATTAATNEAKIAINNAKLASALVKLQSQPMSETQRQAGLTEKLQNLITSGIDIHEYTNYDPITKLYSLKEMSAISQYFGDDASKLKFEREYGLVAAALNSGRGTTSTVPSPTPTPSNSALPSGWVKKGGS